MGAHSDPEQRTWNSPEQIARHRAMSVAERIKLCVELSQAALRFSAARPPERDKDLVDLAELGEIERRD